MRRRVVLGAMLMWVIVAIVLVVFLGGASVAYGGRARRLNRSARAFSEAEVDYEARRDLIPKLEETLRSYTFGPRGALQAVVRARPVLPGCRRQGPPQADPGPS